MMHTLIVHPKTTEQFNALKAFMKALKIDFESPKEMLYKPEQSKSGEQLFLEDLKQAVDDVNLIRAGKKKARNAEDFLKEL